MIQTVSRDSGRTPRLLTMDGRCVLFTIILLVHWSKVTLGLSLASYAFFFALKTRQIEMDYAFRYMKWWLVGKMRLLPSYDFDETGE